jgi:hypothetical protein
MISGTLGRDAIENGRLTGEEIAFTAGGTEYRGRVDGDRMRLGATVNGIPVAWSLRALPRPGGAR